MKKEVFSVQEMDDFAKKIAQKTKKGDIYCLCGDLGSGKTHFTKAFAKYIGIKDEITSPTFNIVNEYTFNDINFFHFDVYRISDESELLDIGYEEYFFNDGICIVEWADLIKPIIPKNAIWININKNIEKGEQYRLIEVINYENISNRH